MSRPERRRSFAGSSRLVLAGETLSGAQVGLLLLLSVPLYLHLGYGFWGSETRWAQVVGAMLSSGNWLEPQIHGDPYLGKPLLSYWTIASIALLVGDLNEFVTRLPSAVAGSLTILLTGQLAARLLGRRIAACAGCLLALSFSFVFWSRSASADLLNLLFVTAAIALYVEARVRFRGWLLLPFFSILALGAHAKGAPAIIIPLVVVVADLILNAGPEVWSIHAARSGPSRAVLAGIVAWAVLALICAGLIFYLPFEASHRLRGDWGMWDEFVRESFVRATDPWDDHIEPPYYYLYVVPLMFMPWGLWLPGALAWAARHWRTSEGFRFALVAFVVILLSYTASESRRSYYVLPIFPLAAVLVAGFWAGLVEAVEGGGSLPLRWRLTGSYPLIALGLLLTTLAAFCVVASQLGPDFSPVLEMLPNLGWAAIALLICASLMVSAWRRRRLQQSFNMALAAAAVFFLYYAVEITSFRDHQNEEFVFARVVHERYRGSDIAFFLETNGRLRYYLGEGPVIGDVEELKEFLRANPDYLVACASSGRDSIMESVSSGDLEGEQLIQTVRRSLQVLPALQIATEEREKYFLYRVVPGREAAG